MSLQEFLPSFRHLAFKQQICRFSIAYALAFLIGWTREHEEGSAGLRTFPLEAVELAN
jgi:uncharacterized membrane protein YhiD involved in acid resistance